MKKVIISAYMVMALAGYAAAQTPPAKVVTKTTHKKTVKKTDNVNSDASVKKQSTVTQTDTKAAGGTISKTGTKVTTTTKKKNP